MTDTVSFCLGDSASITGPAGYAGYLWSDGATDTTNVWASATATYWLQVTDTLGCTGSDTIQAIELSQISTSITATAYDCATDTKGILDLTVSGGTAPYTFLWSNDSISEDLSGLLPGEFILTLTDAASCIAIDTGNVSTSGTIAFSLADPGTICSGDSTLITAPSGYVTYLWSTLETGTNQIYAKDAGKLWVNVTASTGCENLPDTVTLVVNTTPAAPASSDVSVCSGASVPDLTATGTNIIWYDDLINQLATGSPYATGKTALGTYIYYVSQTSGICESPYTQVTLSINAMPVTVELDDTTTLCENDTLNISVTAETGHSYLWMISGTTDTLSNTSVLETIPTSGGDYVFRDLVDASGCERNDTFTLILQSIPVFTVSMEKAVIDSGQSVNITLGAGYSYSFSPDENVSELSSTIFSASPTVNTTYLITGSSTAGCTSDTTVDISVLCEACSDAILVDTVGSFNHGCTDRNYRHTANCSWTIFPSGTFAGIEIRFDSTSFDIKTDDEIRIYQGTDASGILKGTYSNDQLPPDSIIVVGTAAYIHFQSYSAETGQGFQAQYKILHVLGVNEIADGSVNIYPNPNKGSFTLEMEQVIFNEATVEIYSTLGQKIWNRKVEVVNGSIHETIDIPGVPEGMYHLRIVSKEGVYYRTLIKE